jgi:hypothetical protein
MKRRRSKATESTLSLFMVDRASSGAHPVALAHAEEWVRRYLQGDTSFVCFVCERPFALPEAPPRLHVVIGRLDANLNTGGICDGCAQHGVDHCLAGVQKHLRLEFTRTIRPHEISAAGRA